MKWILLSILLVFTFLAGQAQEKQGIDFQDISWKEVRQKASRENKYVFLYAYTKSCRFCRQMEKETFPKPEVIDYYNSGFVSYKINIEDGAGGQALSEQYGIVGFPTYMYFDNAGKRVHQSSGMKPADGFIMDGKNAHNPETALFTLKEKYDGGDRSAAFLYNYSTALDFYADASNPQEKVAGEYLATQSASELESEKNLRFIFTKYLAYQSPTTQYFLQNHEKFTTIFSADEVESRAVGILTQTANRAGGAKDTILLKDVKNMITREFEGNARFSLLTDIHFYGGRRDWIQYARATKKYSDELAGNDWRTLHDTAVYLKHFAKEKEALVIGIQLMEKVIMTERSYENLFLLAQLQRKTGKNTLALNSAKEAVKVASQSGDDSGEATEFIAEVGGVAK
ncbi:MAG: thioredoxin fold domain-containing protein [Dyadobacter sp.]|uniref:thioredoxin family protein n=1 Tax=Dyadobacter sp. TaxID=1914288 RepID=UPI003264DAC8